MAEEKVKYKCSKCLKMLDSTQFYTYKDGRKTELCKKCLTMHVDNYKEDTYLWLLEKMDVPYIPSEWISLRDKAFAKDPFKMNGMSVFGKYLSKMKLNQWNKYSWADTEELRAAEEEQSQAKAEEAASLDELRKQQLEEGIITEAEYKTLTSTDTQNKLLGQIPLGATTAENPYLGANNFYDENDYLSEDEMPDASGQLTPEDKIYLATKWGRLYKPSEWIELERVYDEMMDSFDIQDADSKNTLILLCKTNLKANQCIDSGDVDGYQKLSKVLESLRKTSKFTAAQNKDKDGNVVDSIGELITMCEREGGFIPRFATDIPQDKVDMTLQDQNLYLKRLVTEDLGFGQQIEDAIKRIMIQNEMQAEEAKKQAEAQDDEDNFDPFNINIEDTDMIDYFNNLADQQEAAEIDDEGGDS